MSYENVIFNKEAAIANLYINRPKALNALNKDTLEEIQQVVFEVQIDPEIQVLIISGTGEKAFVAGADIAYMQNLSAVEGRAFGALGQAVFRSIETMEKPVIAAVNGFALGGGCELAMCCDFRIASPNALFGQPEVGLGITPGFGGTQRLPRLVGEGMAKQLIYTAANIDANEAFRIGLVNQIVPAENLIDYVFTLAQTIIRNAPQAVRYTKLAINEGMQTDIDRAMTIEADLFGLCFATRDQSEGMAAFLEKRKPKYNGQ